MHILFYSISAPKQALSVDPFTGQRTPLLPLTTTQTNRPSPPPSIPHSNTLVDPIRSPPSSPRSAVALSLHKFNRIDAISVKVRLGDHVTVRIHARARIRLLVIDGGDLSHVCFVSAARLRVGPDAAVAPGPTAESHGEAIGLPVDIDTAN